MLQPERTRPRRCPRTLCPVPSPRRVPIEHPRLRGDLVHNRWSARRPNPTTRSPSEVLAFRPWTRCYASSDEQANAQRGRPTSAQHLAAATLALLDRGTRGTLHVTDGGEYTWYDFTVKIARLLGRSAIIRPCTTTEFPCPAARPAYSVLDLAPAEAILGPMPDWRIKLASAVTQLEPRWGQMRSFAVLLLGPLPLLWYLQALQRALNHIGTEAPKEEPQIIVQPGRAKSTSRIDV